MAQTSTQIRIAVDDPRQADIQALLGHHLAFASSNSPPEDVHALDVDRLLDPAITFFSLRRNGDVLAVGALKQLDDGHAELKSMHTAEQVRGQGFGRSLLEYLLAVAADRGYERVSLETGSMPAFTPARSLYASVGFIECGPFADYAPSVNSTFMTLAIAPA